VNPRPAPPPDLAGRWLSKFFIDHLAGERAASPKTISSYRDAMKLLLIWFRDGSAYRLRSCAWATSTGPGSCGSWTGWKPSGTAQQLPATSASR